MTTDGEREVRREQPEDFSPPLDEGIAPYVKVLREHGVETFESCQGGDGHSYSDPTVLFLGGLDEGARALDVALKHGLPVYALQRVWILEEDVRGDPHWELVFI